MGVTGSCRTEEMTQATGGERRGDGPFGGGEGSQRRRRGGAGAPAPQGSPFNRIRPSPRCGVVTRGGHSVFPVLLLMQALLAHNSP